MANLLTVLKTNKKTTADEQYLRLFFLQNEKKEEKKHCKNLVQDLSNASGLSASSEMFSVEGFVSRSHSCGGETQKKKG